MLALLLPLGVAVQAAVAADNAVDLELVLAVDVSRSMDVDEQQLQRQGYVAAFRDPSVIGAIRSGLRGRIAVTYFEWSDTGFNHVVMPWTLLASRADTEAFATALGEAPISRGAGTSISSGLLFAANRLNASPFAGDRRAVDISGDGPNNGGLPVVAARDWLVRQGVTINGLPIMVKTVYSYEPFVMTDLDAYYAGCVIGGPGSFMVVVDSPANFESAIRHKLQLEVAGLQPRLMSAAMTASPLGVDCLAGENARDRRFRMLLE